MHKTARKIRKSDFGSVHSLPSGNYLARYTDSATGKRRSAGSHATERAAWDALEDVRYRLRHPEQPTTGAADGAPPAPPQPALRHPAASAPTFDQVARALIARRERQTDTFRPGTLRNYRSMLRTMLADFEGIPIDRITAEDVTEWWIDHTEQPVGRRNAYFFMNVVFRFAQTKPRAYVTESPCQVPNAHRDVAKTRPVFTEAQFNAVVEQLSPAMARAAKVLFGAHLRVGELAALRWRDWHAVEGILHVERGSRAKPTTANGAATFGPTKNGDEKILFVLENAATALAEQWILHPAGPDDLIFRGERSLWLNPVSLRQAWSRAAAAAGVPEMRLHDVRHVSLTFVAQTGATVRELMRRGGHRDEKAAMRYQSASDVRDAQVAREASRRLAEG